MCTESVCVLLFFFNDTATTEIYTLSLHDALPISDRSRRQHAQRPHHAEHADQPCVACLLQSADARRSGLRSEEHTSELQSQSNLVCRLLLEKKKTHHKDTQHARS